jgi:hypothetical protein
MGGNSYRSMHVQKLFGIQQGPQDIFDRFAPQP